MCAYVANLDVEVQDPNDISETRLEERRRLANEAETGVLTDDEDTAEQDIAPPTKRVRTRG